MPNNDFRMRALSSQALRKTVLRGRCEPADKGSFLTLVFVPGKLRHVTCRVTFATAVWRPAFVPGPGPSSPWAAFSVHGKTSWSSLDAKYLPVPTSPGSWPIPKSRWPLVAQSLLPEPLTHGPKCPVAPRRLHVKVWLRGSKPPSDAADVSFGHLLLWWDMPGLPLQCFHCPRPGKAPLWCLRSPACEVPLLPPLPRSIREYISLSLFFFPSGIYSFFLFPITPLMQSRAADYKRGSLTRAIGLLH